MQQIADNIFIEDQYLGVTVGAINLPHGLIQIDAPPSPEDVRTWRAALLNLGGSAERVLVNLDAHPDRTLGARAMDCIVIAHEKAAQVFRNRPTSFKAQGEATGADWETLSGFGNIRWAPPEISFSQQLLIHWNEAPVLLEHHPGPSAGAIWAILPEAEIVFVGDAVLRNQPPFLASADLPVWRETLKLLLSAEFRNYLVVSGRGGLIAVEAIRSQLHYLEQIQAQMEKMAAKRAPANATENLIPHLLSGLKFAANRQEQYTQRLRHGLYHYYTRHHQPSNNIAGEE